jgi:CRP-like cAMP-binding protein
VLAGVHAPAQRPAPIPAPFLTARLDGPGLERRLEFEPVGLCSPANKERGKMTPSSQENAGNRFLMAMPPEAFARLADQMTTVQLARGTVLAHAGAALGRVYLPTRGLVSLVRTMSDGRTAEVGVVGTEGIVGVGALVGMARAPFEHVVQLDGSARAIETARMRAEMEQSPALKGLAQRYLYYAVHQIGQTAACNRLHTLRQRCCRWLLTAHDHAKAPEFTLTHEFLAMMIGVNRPSFSLAVARLQRRGLIRYRRATLEILDRPGLESGSCECYASLRQECDQAFGA